jgi:hypothetical protein
MRPSIETTCGLSATWKLGLLVLVVLLPLLLMSCASTKHLAQSLEENHGTFLTPLPAPTPKPAVKPDPLQVCATVPADDLQDMRGCGVYFFEYDFDINLTSTPQLKVGSSFQALVPGDTKPTVTNTSAIYVDNNVAYTAGVFGPGLGSSLAVGGSNNIVFANTQFNFRLPDASVLIPSITVLPAASLNAIGR